MQKLPMEKRVIRALQHTWDYIKYDALALTNGEMSADEIRNMVPDYLYRDNGDPEAYDAWQAMSRTEKDKMLEEAFPMGVCI